MEFSIISELGNPLVIPSQLKSLNNGVNVFSVYSKSPFGFKIKNVDLGSICTGISFWLWETINFIDGIRVISIWYSETILSDSHGILCVFFPSINDNGNLPEMFGNFEIDLFNWILVCKWGYFLIAAKIALFCAFCTGLNIKGENNPTQIPRRSSSLFKTISKFLSSLYFWSYYSSFDKDDEMLIDSSCISSKLFITSSKLSYVRILTINGLEKGW